MKAVQLDAEMLKISNLLTSALCDVRDVRDDIRTELRNLRRVIGCPVDNDGVDVTAYAMEALADSEFADIVERSADALTLLAGQIRDIANRVERTGDSDD